MILLGSGASAGDVILQLNSKASPLVGFPDSGVIAAKYDDPPLGTPVKVGVESYLNCEFSLW